MHMRKREDIQLNGAEELELSNLVHIHTQKILIIPIKLKHFNESQVQDAELASKSEDELDEIFSFTLAEIERLRDLIKDQEKLLGQQKVTYYYFLVITQTIRKEKVPQQLNKNKLN